MRNFDVAVPADSIISINPDANRSALEHMRETLKADTSLSKTIIDKLDRLCASASKATATRDLQNLAEKNILIPTGGGRSTHYKINL